jgi:hypothetical protein
MKFSLRTQIGSYKRLHRGHKEKAFLFCQKVCVPCTGVVDVLDSNASTVWELSLSKTLHATREEIHLRLAEKAKTHSANKRR